MCLHTAVMSCLFVSVKLGLPELEVVFFRFPSTVDCSVNQMSLPLLELPPSCPQDKSVEVHLQATGKLAVCNLKCQGITKVVKIHRDGDVNVCTRSQAA